MGITIKTGHRGGIAPATPLAWLGWAALAIVGAVSLGFVALQRGEPINALWIVVAALCVYVIAYRFYGLFIARNVLGVDPAR